MNSVATAFQPCQMSPDITRTHMVGCEPVDLPEIDFSLVLARTIDSIQADPAQLRSTVYELARTKLLRIAWEGNPPIGTLESRRLMRALETAIERVEMHASRQDELRALRSIAELISPAHSAASSKSHQRDSVFIIDQTAIASDASIIPSSSAPSECISLSPRKKGTWSHLATAFRAGFVAVVVMVLCLTVSKYVMLAGPKAPSGINTSTRASDNFSTQESILAARGQSPIGQPQPPALPLPSVYGIYAVSNDQLYELEALPGRVPDQRVFMSTPVKTPSNTMLPDGRISFIVFRRDMTVSAPDRVTVRVIAKVMRDMTFNTAGKASTSTLDDHWAIRSTSYDFRVAPLNDHPEMILLRPEHSDFVLPPGRYGLVLKGQAFDFNIAGPITEPAQCLERVAAANGTFYSECRSR
jgi:hypothetical protein